MHTADEVMAAYSSLDEKEQAKFDKRYKELMAFRRGLRSLTNEFIANAKKKNKGK